MTEPVTRLKFVTLGVYGFTPSAFFEALQRAGVDTFCDIRWRRGVRGREYAFANSARKDFHFSYSGSSCIGRSSSQFSRVGLACTRSIKVLCGISGSVCCRKVVLPAQGSPFTSL